MPEARASLPANDVGSTRRLPLRPDGGPVRGQRVRSPLTPAADRAIVAAARSELAGVEPARACCRAAELAGLARAPSRRRSPSLARLAMRLERPVAAEGGPAGGRFDWETAADHCRLAYLRGRFLAAGSLSLAGGRTHLEFVVPTAEAAQLGPRLRPLGLPASVRNRRGAGVVTWKSAETVATFLRLAGAPAAALELEAQLVSRSLRGELNRTINAEHANLRRQVAAATRQLEAIEQLAGSGRLEALPPRERTIAAARREAPEATFGELSARLGLTRSLVQRGLARLESAALHAERAPAGGRAGRRGRRR